MSTEKNDYISADMFRYFGGTRIPLIERLFLPLQIKFICTLRKAQFSHNPILRNYYKLKLRQLSIKSMIQIPSSTKIGKGFYIGHCGRIIVSPNVEIGDNVNIATGVTIGQTNRGERQGTPTIGNKVWIGTNAVIVGQITIGDDVLIAPNAYINFDVPSHAVVLGNPARIILKDNATRGYINRIFEK